MDNDTRETSFPFHSVGITGATGTIAGQFQELLLSHFPQVARIRSTCRNPESESARRLPLGDRLELLGGGIRNVDNLRTLAESSDVVYHLAAWLANTELPGITEVFVANSLATGILARLCRRHGTPLVFTSSHSVYFAGEYSGVIKEDGFQFRRDFMNWIDEVEPHYTELADRIIAGSVDFRAANDAVDGIHAELPPPFDPKIYDNDSYHVYCLSKLLAEEFALRAGGFVVRLSNVYGPGDDSPQAVSEACQRVLAAGPGEHLEVRQPFKRLVPVYMGDICRCFVRAASLEPGDGVIPLFTVASQKSYMREDELLRRVAGAVNEVRGTDRDYDIETLPPEETPGFVYDLSKMHDHLLPEDEVTPFSEGVRRHIAWLMDRLDID